MLALSSVLVQIHVVLAIEHVDFRVNVSMHSSCFSQYTEFHVNVVITYSTCRQCIRCRHSISQAEVRLHGNQNDGQDGGKELHYCSNRSPKSTETNLLWRDALGEPEE